MPPDLGILLVVPVHRVFLVTFPVARREPDALTVLVKVINLSGFREPLAVFVHCPDGQQNVGVWVSISLVVDGKIGNHALGNKLLLTDIPLKSADSIKVTDATLKIDGNEVEGAAGKGVYTTCCYFRYIGKIKL